MRNALTTFCCLSCLAIFALRAERAVTLTSATFDEAVHLTAGYSYWRSGDFRMNRETPPLMKLIWALPLLLTDHPPFNPDADQWERNDIWRMGDAFLYESPVPSIQMLEQARRVNVAFGAALVALVGWWALRLWGRPAGIAAWALAALDPNLIGQSAVLSTDVGLALFCTAVAYSLWEYAKTPSNRWLIGAGVCFGLALATKFSALAAVAGCGLGAIVFVLAGGSFALPGEPIPSERRARLVRVFSTFVRLGIIAVLVILPSYFFLKALDWPRGLRLQLGRNEFEPPHYFLNGEVSTTGWWYYFPEVLALKTPAGTLFLAIASVFTALGLPKFTRRDIAFMVVPAIVFLLAMAAARINIGVRVILPAYPLLWLLGARVASLGERPVSRWFARVMVALAILSPPIWNLDVNGRDLSYFNGVPDLHGQAVTRETGHKYLGDSNIDWGQGLGSLSVDLRARGNPVIYLSYAGTARPEAYGIRYERLTGWGQFQKPGVDRVDRSGPILIAVSVSNLQGTYLRDPEMYRWLLEREPISRTDGSIWLFDITGDAAALERLRN